MKVNHSPVNYSSIVEIGEKVSKLESETNDVYLKLHRGVMDVHLIDVNSFMKEFDYNQKSIIHYGNNDGDPQLINVIKKVINNMITIIIRKIFPIKLILDMCF